MKTVKFDEIKVALDEALTVEQVQRLVDLNETIVGLAGKPIDMIRVEYSDALGPHLHLHSDNVCVRAGAKGCDIRAVEKADSSHESVH